MSAVASARSLDPLDPDWTIDVPRTHDEAIVVARALAADFAPGASDRDRDRVLPWAEVERFSRSGLWAIQVPSAYGGPDLPTATLTSIIRIIAEADPSIAQIPQNHYCFVEHIARIGSPEQKDYYLDRVLKGDRFGNGFSEKTGKTIRDIQTRFEDRGDHYILNGEKFYSTGALFAHWVPVVGLDPDGKPLVAILPHDASGLDIVDDWSGFGQRTTASGTLRARDVRVEPAQLLYTRRAYEVPTAAGPYAQINHAAIDTGIASAALADLVRFVRERSRPWIDSGLDRASDDPHVIRDVGRLTTALHASEALLERASHLLDAARAAPSEDTVASASLATAEARIASTEIAIEATTKLFELAGTRSALEADNLDRHWRNARVHTLHDPVRWKHHAVGDFVLNGRKPPRHAWL
ncbi:SfnB family sulfur acquisition oxidoreductase [Enterovirga rhinocerotis]|uniref:SfnB family sulfur acquisition oxidoreductase n=1 Tax=Enterovirga rhinocerotis TaxID=1339210 RepID=A0A4R7BLW4_9HYPH|nr:SfnB family sulfur acquisition oxidoreductase [Enterovirga rhinocerotis]TDR85255.1 SfnB family sulfur acquisition oxidoreductase [Enterovirga rhinocerotis]